MTCSTIKTNHREPRYEHRRRCKRLPEEELQPTDSLLIARKKSQMLAKPNLQGEPRALIGRPTHAHVNSPLAGSKYNANSPPP